MIDNKTRKKVVNLLALQNITSNTTTNGSAVSIEGFNSATIIFETGARTDGSYEILVSYSDDNITFTSAADYLIATTAEKTINTANTIKTIGLKSALKWVKIAVVSSGVTAGALVGAKLVLEHPQYAPVTQ